jgi:hypothetical protein
VKLRGSYLLLTLPDDRTIKAKVYSQQSQKIYTGLLGKYPALVNRKRVLLQQDNARPHRAMKTHQKIEELEVIEQLPHPAFSPDLEPSDHYLFRSMASSLVVKVSICSGRGSCG